MRKFSVHKFFPIIYWECNLFSTSLNAFKKVINPFLPYFVCFSSICLHWSECSKGRNQASETPLETPELWVIMGLTNEDMTLKRLCLLQEPNSSLCLNESVSCFIPWWWFKLWLWRDWGIERHKTWASQNWSLLPTPPPPPPLVLISIPIQSLFLYEFSANSSIPNVPSYQKFPKEKGVSGTH